MNLNQEVASKAIFRGVSRVFRKTVDGALLPTIFLIMRSFPGSLRVRCVDRGTTCFSLFFNIPSRLSAIASLYLIRWRYKVLLLGWHHMRNSSPTLRPLQSTFLSSIYISTKFSLCSLSVKNPSLQVLLELLYKPVRR